MKMNRAGVFFIFFIVLTGCKKPEQQPVIDDLQVVTTSTGEMFYLEPDQLINLQMLAKKGDVVAAMRVAEYYELAENNPRLAYPWLVIAAEKGNISAMKGLGINLSAEGGADNCKEALGWYERAKREAKKPKEVKQHFLDEAILNLNANFQKCIDHGYQ